ncbi:MAG TPA: hypothetical protein DCM27_05390, partial [Rhodospirillaceae bacterium]|nr:hypothetical protein [Rhodospirillaceae bacterium]
MPTKKISTKTGKIVAKTSGRSAQLALAGARRSVATSQRNVPEIAPPAPPPSRKQKTADVSRLVIGKDGKLIFMSPDMGKILGLKENDLAHIAFRDLIQFTNPDDALRDRPHFGFGDDSESPSEDAWVASICSGEHEIVPLLNKKSKPVMLRFDVVDLSEGRGYVIVSTLSAHDDANLEDFVTRIIHPASPTEDPAPSSLFAAITAAAEWDGYLSALSDMGNDFMMVLSPRGKIINANAPFYTALSLAPDEVKGKNFLDMVNSEDKPYVQPIFKNLFQDDRNNLREVIAFECRIRGTSKMSHWLDCRIKPHEGQLLMVCRDLTDSKRHEAELLRR